MEKITLFLTGDIHGRDEQSARLYTLYKREREKAESEGRFCLFLDAGDASDRAVDYCGLTNCAAYGHLLNAFGYDVQVVGNDIALAFGPEALEAALKRLDYPVLGANFRNGDGPVLPGLRESLLLVRGGVKIGIFGLTSPWNGAYEDFGFHFPDTAACAGRQIAVLKARGAPVGIPQISGLRVEMFPTRRTGERISEILVGTRPLEEEREYRIAHTDLENHLELGFFPPEGHVQKAVHRNRTLKDILRAYLENDGKASAAGVSRWIGIGG